MKKCPYCAEDIQTDAIKCKHCSEFLVASVPRPVVGHKLPWYFNTSFIVIVIATVGPLGLPLLWWRPNTSRWWKAGLTIGVLILSWIFYQITMESLRSIDEYLQLLDQI